MPVTKLNLDQTTLIAVDTLDVERALFGIEQCRRFAEFADVKLLTPLETDSPYAIRIGEREIIDAGRSYSEFVYYRLADFVDTDFVLLCQWDGWIVDPTYFHPHFFNFDFVGNLYPWVIQDNPLRLRTGGNGGFSLRSRRLLKWSRENEKLLRLFHATHHYSCEDLMFSIVLYHRLRRDGLSVAPAVVACRWGIQGLPKEHLRIEPEALQVISGCFGQHQATQPIPVFPRYVDRRLVEDIRSATFDGKDVTETFQYYWPVWLKTGAIAGDRRFRNMLFAGDFFCQNGTKDYTLTFEYGEKTFRLHEHQRMAIKDIINS